ncbi:hypothetical protein Plhal304r1_c051g0134531 [Plasmopara halstedii]
MKKNKPWLPAVRERLCAAPNLPLTECSTVALGTSCAVPIIPTSSDHSLSASLLL